MLKTMKLLLAAAFLLAGLSLAGCKNCKEDNNGGTGSVTPPSKIDKVFYLYLVDKKTSKPLIGENPDQISPKRLDFIRNGYGIGEYHEYLVKDLEKNIDLRTGHTIFGPFTWGAVQEIIYIRVLDEPIERKAGQIPYGYTLLWVAARKEAEIIDECNSKIWVDYSHYKKGVSTQSVLVSKYKGNGLTDTLRIEVER